MKNLLLTVTLFVLVAFLQAQDDLSLLSEENKLSGVWYMKAKVDEKNVTELERSLVTFPHRVSILEQGTLEVRTTVAVEGQCIKISYMLQKTEEPGQYTTFSGQTHCYIYELPVKDHYVVYSKVLHMEKVQMGVLLGKFPEENLEALEEFKTFIQRKGLLQENIIVPEQREHCIPKHHSDHQDHNC